MSAAAPLQTDAVKPRSGSHTPQAAWLPQPRGEFTDGYEREADDVADQVLATAADRGAPPRIRAQQTRQAHGVPASVGQVLANPGRPLDPALRRDMERRFGHDFSQVRVHTGAGAEQSARDVQADAYTVGRSIVFGAGRFVPDTQAGRRLLAHELAHVVQQASAAHAGVLQRKPRPDASPPLAEVHPVPGETTESAPTGAPEAPPTMEPDPAEAPAPQRTATSVPVGGPPAPPTEFGPGEPPHPASDAGAAALPPQAAPPTAAPADDSSMPRLTELLSQPQPPAVASGAGSMGVERGSAAQGETSAHAEVDRTALLGTLARGTGAARKTITAHARAARSWVDRRVTTFRRKVKERTDTANAAVHVLAGKRREELDKTIRDTEKGIQTQEATNSYNAGEYATNAKKAQTDGFAFYRGQLEGAFNKWVRYTEKLRGFEVDRLKRAVADNAAQARHLAQLYDKRYIRSNTDQSEARMAVQRDAANDVADAYAKEFKKVEPEVVAEISKACTGLGAELAKHRDQAMADYDKGLPIVLRGIDEQLTAARTDIADRARQALELLAKAATEMRARVGSLESKAIGRNAGFLAKVDAQIESGKASAERQIWRAIPDAMDPIATIVDQAVGILTKSDGELDADASRMFVGEVVDFALGAADATGAVFVAARDATIGALGSAVPFVSRGLAAGEKDLDSTLRAEGVENGRALIKYAGATKLYLAASLTALDETFYAAVNEAGTTLTALVNDARQKLRESMGTAKTDIHQAVSNALYEQRRALHRLPNAMHSAAREAAWRYDHSILKYVVDAVEVILGFVLIVGVLVVIVVTAVALIGEVAAAILLAAVGGFLLGFFGAQAYDKRRKAGATRVSALFGAIADVTGINDVRRAFTDAKMSPFQRGMAWGGFWLNLFGLGAGASRFFHVIKLRLPPRFTNPFRLRRAPGPAAAPELPVTPSPRVGGFAREPELVPPSAPDAPVTPSRRVGGFAREPELVAPPAPDVPVTPSRRVGGFAREPEPVVRVAPEGPSVATTSATKKPTATTQSTGATRVGPRGEQRAQAVAGPQEAAPKAPGGDAGSTTPATPGKVVPAVERVQPAAPTPIEVVPSVATPRTRRVAAAERRVDETRQVMIQAQQRAAAAEARVKVLTEELEVAKQLRSELGRQSKEARELIATTKGELGKARKELGAAQKALKKTTREAQEVARAQEAIHSLEREIVDIDRRMAGLAREPEPGTQLNPTANVRPPTSTPKGRQYSQLEKLRAKRVAELTERTKDLTRSLAEHVASMTPGAEGRPHALANAKAIGETHPALKPVDGKPIDVTTGKPMETGNWASDHIQPRKEIASDPRFALLDPMGREQMLLGIPENYLPMTVEANSSKGALTVNQWLAKRAIRSDIAEALRAADRKARAAVEAKFEELLGATR